MLVLLLFLFLNNSSLLLLMLVVIGGSRISSRLQVLSLRLKLLLLSLNLSLALSGVELLLLLIAFVALLLVTFHRDGGCVLGKLQRALESLGNFGRDGRAVEEELNTFGKERHVVVEGGLDVSFGVEVGEGDETDLTGLGVDGGVGALVEALADVQEVIEGIDVGPSAASTAGGASGGVRLDVEEMLGEVDFGAEDFDHLGDEFDVAFLGELTHEDAEGSDITRALTGSTLVTERGVVTERTLPGNLSLVGVVGVGEDGLNRREDRDEGGSLNILSEGCVRGSAEDFLLVLLVVIVISLL